MGKASRDKGKRGELDAAHFIEKYWGVRAKRGQQHRGGDDSPDIRTAMPGVVFEVKRRERLSPYQALGEVLEDCEANEVPAVLWRKNRNAWLLMIRATEFPEFVASYLRAVGIEVPEFDGKLF